MGGCSSPYPCARSVLLDLFVLIGVVKLGSRGVGWM